MLGADNMANAFINSLIVTIPATIIPITIAAFAAYAFAWMRFPFRGTLFMLVVALLVVPLQMALIPVQQFYSFLGINNTFLGVWLAHTAFGLPLAIFLLYNFISQLPGDLFETASIDGATHFQMFTKVVLPLSVPALAAFAIFQFLWVWNDLLVALVFLGAQPDESVMTLELEPPGRWPRPAVAPADRRRVRDHDPAGARVPGAAALLRARHPVRLRQGLRTVASGRLTAVSWPSDPEHAPSMPRRAARPAPLLPEEAVLGQLLPAFDGTEAARLAAATHRRRPCPRRHRLPACQCG